MTNLYIKNIEYGVQKCGPGIGNPSLFITLDEQEATENKSITGKELYDSLVEKMAQEDFNKYWNIALNGSQKVMIVFTGSVMAKDEHFSTWDEFYTCISQESAIIQKALYENTPQKLRPPFIIWMGTPKVFSSQKQFYEYFSMCLGMIDSNEKYNDLAVQELLNHTFSNIVITIDNMEEYENKYTNFVKKFYSIPSHKLRVVTSNKDVFETCLKNSIRVEGLSVYGRFE